MTGAVCCRQVFADAAVYKAWLCVYDCGNMYVSGKLLLMLQSIKRGFVCMTGNMYVSGKLLLMLQSIKRGFVCMTGSMYVAGKLLLMLQSIKRGFAAEPNDPKLHTCLVHFHLYGKSCVLTDC